MNEESSPPKPLSLRCFRDSNGEQPARIWLESIHWKDRKIVGEKIRNVQENWPVGPPLVVALSDEVWEVRCHLQNGFARVVFLVKDNEMILVRGHISRTSLGDKEEVLDEELHHKLDVAAKAFFVYQAEEERKKQKLSKAEQYDAVMQFKAGTISTLPKTFSPVQLRSIPLRSKRQNKSTRSTFWKQLANDSR